MMLAAKIISALCGIFCTIISIYQVWVCLGVFLKKERRIPVHPAACRIAAVIPARNEEHVIGGIVRSLKKQDYPEDLFDIYVVPNNCSDRTEQIAIEAGARILHCEDAVHSKGDVLRQTFAKLLARDQYDAFCIFDADNIVVPGFFRSANNAWCAGYDCAQGYRESKNPGDSWIAGSMTVFYRFMGKVFNESRWRRKMSVHLNGTGIMVSARFLSCNGWNTNTLTEDLEFTAQCALADRSIAWMSDAVVYDEQPVTFRDSAVQRRRWTTGSLQCTRRLSLRLLSKGTAASMDIGLLFIGNLMNYIGVLTPFLMIVNPVIPTAVARFGLLNSIVIGIFYAALIWAFFSLAAYLVLRVTPRIPNAKQTILLFPLFMYSWMVINLYASFTRAPQWKPIPHTSDAMPDSMK